VSLLLTCQVLAAHFRLLFTAHSSSDYSLPSTSLPTNHVQSRLTRRCVSHPLSSIRRIYSYRFTSVRLLSPLPCHADYSWRCDFITHPFRLRESGHFRPFDYSFLYEPSRLTVRGDSPRVTTRRVSYHICSTIRVDACRVTTRFPIQPFPIRLLTSCTSHLLSDFSLPFQSIPSELTTLILSSQIASTSRFISCRF
jgi:hypothetical protein